MKELFIKRIFAVLFSVFILFTTLVVPAFASNLNSQILIEDMNDFTVSKNVSSVQNITGVNTNWLKVEKVQLENDVFTDSLRITSIGTLAHTENNQVRLMIDLPEVTTNHYIWLSLYYRVNSQVNGVQYSSAPTFGVCQFGNKSVVLQVPRGQGTSNIDTSADDEWKKLEYLSAFVGRVPATEKFIQLASYRAPQGVGAYSIDISGIRAVLFNPEGYSNAAEAFDAMQQKVTTLGMNSDLLGEEHEPYYKYGITLTGEYYKNAGFDWNNGQIKGFSVSENELRGYLRELPEVKGEKAMQGNYAFVSNSEKFWNKTGKAVMNEKCIMDEKNEFFIPSQTAYDLFGIAQTKDYISATEIADYTGLEIFKDVRGFLMLSEDISSSVDTTVNSNGYYNDAYTIAFCIGMITWDDISPNENDYAKFRNKWIESMTYPSEAQGKYISFVNTAYSTALQHMALIDRTPNASVPFSDIVIPYRDGSHNPQIQIENAYKRIKDMAMAYYLARESGYSQIDLEQLKDDILYALELMHRKHYANNTYIYGGTPRMLTFKCYVPGYLADIMAFMYDEMSDDARKKYADEAFGRAMYINNVDFTNRIWFSEAYLKLAVLVRDHNRINHVFRGFSQVFIQNKKGGEHPITPDGFYEDGTFIYHNSFPYNMGYGKSLIISLAELVCTSVETVFDMKNVFGYEKIYSYIENSYLPFIQDGAVMKAFQGRENAGYPIRAIMAAIMLITKGAPSSVMENLSELIKPHIVRNQYENHKYFDTFLYMTYPGIIEELAPYLDYLETLEGKTHSNYNKIYYNADRAVHRKDDFTFVLSMSSERIGKYESDNVAYLQSLTQWYIGDGMTYIYDGKQNYGNAWFDGANPYYMPGVTVDSTVRSTTQTFSLSKDEWGLPENSWAGGASDGAYGVAGMILGNQWVSGLAGKKSYFMLGDKIVCVGSGIEGGYGQVYTVIDNRGADSQIFVNGTPSSVGVYADPDWIWLDDETGYIFLGKGEISIERQSYSGTNTHMVLSALHGESPSDSKYAYAIIPNATMAETQSLYDEKSLSVIENSENMHAVRDSAEGVIAANIFSPSRLGGIEFIDPCSVIMKNDGGNISLHISDPTQKLKTLTLRLPKGALLQSGGEYDENGNVALDLSGFPGKTHILTYKPADTALAYASVDSIRSYDPITIEAICDYYGKAGDTFVVMLAAYEDKRLIDFDITEYEAVIYGDRQRVSGKIEALAENDNVELKMIVWKNLTELAPLMSVENIMLVSD